MFKRVKKVILKIQLLAQKSRKKPNTSGQIFPLELLLPSFTHYMNASHQFVEHFKFKINTCIKRWFFQKYFKSIIYLLLGVLHVYWALKSAFNCSFENRIFHDLLHQSSWKVEAIIHISHIQIWKRIWSVCQNSVR